MTAPVPVTYERRNRAAKADYEVLYDIRVAGPFTVESLSPHRTLPMDEDDEAEASEVRTNALRNKWATAIRISRR